MSHSKVELEKRIDYFKDLYKESGQDRELASMYLLLLTKANERYLQMLVLEHEKETFGYVVSNLDNLDKEIQDEIKFITSSIKVKLDSDFSHVIWQAEFCRKCEESIFSEQLKGTSKYQNEFKKATKGLLAQFGLTEDYQLTKEYLAEYFKNRKKYFESLLTASKCGVATRSWMYINLYLPIFPGWQIADQAELLKNHKLLDIPSQLLLQ